MIRVIPLYPKKN